MLNFSKNKYNLNLWLSIIRSPGIGPKTFWQHYAKDPLLKEVQTTDVALEMEQHETLKFSLCAGFEENYPEKLHHLADAPPVFSYGGNLGLLKKQCIGIVGARNASPGGKRLAFEMSRRLGQVGFVIVSGMARGIDGAAHEGILDTGTIAVLAGGVDVIYPPEHKKLYEQIRGGGEAKIREGQGCVLSEMPLGTMPAAPLFPRRNRIIAALCQGLVVIEAAAKSGTLITAMQAIDLGRDVFVVPGSPLDPRSRGGNALIKQGAILIESADDIINYYENNLSQINPGEHHVTKERSFIKVEQSKQPKSKKDALNHRSQIQEMVVEEQNDVGWLSSLGLEPVSIEEIMSQNKDITSQTLFAELALLEMDGVIKRFPDGRIAKVFL